MIILNGAAFAESEKEFVTTIFEPVDGRSAFGYATRNKRHIVLTNAQHQRVGVINAQGVIGRASLQPDGRYWYSYGDVDGIGRYESYSKSVQEPASYARDKDSRGYIFK